MRQYKPLDNRYRNSYSGPSIHTVLELAEGPASQKALTPHATDRSSAVGTYADTTDFI